jgi:hypothetical protein
MIFKSIRTYLKERRLVRNLDKACKEGDRIRLERYEKYGIGGIFVTLQEVHAQEDLREFRTKKLNK